MTARKPQRGSTRHIQKVLQAKQAKEDARLALSQAVKEAREAGVPAVEIAAALGVSRMRVYQLSA